MVNRIEDFIHDERYKKFLDIVKVNSPEGYGGLKLYSGRRDYLMQVPEEFAALLTFLVDRIGNQPIKFLEVGTGSNLTNSMFWNHLNLVENVIVDNLECPGVAETLWGNLSYKPGTMLLVGDSTSAKIHDKVSSLDMKYDLIFLDGNHEYEYVKNDFEFYSTLVKDGGYFIFHDIDNDKVPGVRKFVKSSDILKEQFNQVCEFVSTTEHINKFTFGSQCGLGVFQRRS